jgi:hypothetical protein
LNGQFPGIVCADAMARIEALIAEDTPPPMAA